MSVLIDASAIPVSSFTESFFFKPGYNKRFSSREYMVYHQKNSYQDVVNNQINFFFPKWTNG